MGSDIIIRPTLLSIQRSCETPLTVKSLGVHKLKNRIVDGTHPIGSLTVLPNGSLTLLGVNHLHLFALESIGEVSDIVILTSPSGDITGDRLTVTIEVGTIESTGHDATVLTVHMGTQEIVLLVAVLTILLEDRNFVKIEIDNRMQRQIGGTTNVSVLSLFLGRSTDALTTTLTREHRANKFTLICHS